MIAIAMTPPHACYSTIANYYAINRERGPFHTTILTDGDYAFVSWYGVHSGGEGMFRRRAGRWCVLSNSGGAYNVDEMVHAGMPRPTAQRLFDRMQKVFAKRDRDPA